MKKQLAVPHISPKDRIVAARLARDVVPKYDTVLDAARYILGTCYIGIRANLHPMQVKTDPVYLHDFRVAMRRFRTALRFFATELQDAGSRRIVKSLADLSDLLSPIRDSQAWLEFLESPDVIAACHGDPLWAAYVDGRRRHMRRQWRRMRGVCRMPGFHIAMLQMHALLRSSLPHLEGEQGTGPFRVFAAERLSDTYRIIVKLDGDVYAMKPEELHDRRKIYRRARYVAEFSRPVLGNRIDGLQRLLKRQASALGVVHDVDVHLLTLPTHATAVPTRLHAYGVALRRKSLERLVAGQARLASKKFRSQVHSVLTSR